MQGMQSSAGTQAIQTASTQAMQRSAGTQAVKELIWRKGDERCERSSKALSVAQHQQPALAAQQALAAHQQQALAAHQQQAVAHTSVAQQALAGKPHQQPGFRQVSTKREEASAKMNERYLVGQPNQNPFRPSNNYLEDIEVQMNFLTPQKSC
jgi:hypothetical protein